MKDKRKQNTYKKMQRFVTVTETFLLNGNIKRAKRCLDIAEELLRNGNAETRRAVSNVFVFSVSGFMELHRFRIKTFFSQLLLSEYYKQAYCSGC